MSAFTPGNPHFISEPELMPSVNLTLPMTSNLAVSSATDTFVTECVKQGWAIEAGEAGKTVKPAPIKPTVPTVSTTTPDYLQKMARHITFLEQQSLG